jgi:hypothetical protein
MAEIDNDDPVGAFVPEQPLDENPVASPAEDSAPVWAIDKEDPKNPVASSSEDFSPLWAIDQQERDFWVLPAAIDSSRPTSLPVPVGPDFWVAPAALDSRRRTSRLVPVGTAIVLVVALVAIVELRLIPRSWPIKWSRVTHSEVAKAPQQPASPSIAHSSATAPKVVTEAAPAPAQQTVDRPNVTSSPDDRSVAKRERTAITPEKSSPSKVTSSRVASGRPPSAPARSSPLRTAAVPIRPRPALSSRPAPDKATPTAEPTKAIDATPRPDPPSSIATAGLPPTSAATSLTATTGAPLAPSPASRLPESTPVSPIALPAASTPAATTTTPTATAAAASESAVRSALGRYASAYRRLNVGEAKAIWPSVDTKALGRAFAGLESQKIYFRDCQVSVAVTTAKAHCVGTAEFVPKVGNRIEHLESREWMFEMKKTGEQWTIAHLDVH